MAIEFIPKPKIKIPAWAIILLIFCIILLLGGLGSYLYFDKTSKKLSRQIQEKENALIETPSEKELKENLFFTEKKINNLGNLISARRKSFNIFTFLEEICHPQVWFSEFSFDSKGESVAVKGKAEGLVSLGQQISALKKEQILKKINLSGVSMGQDGKIEFSLQLTFDPQIFK